MVLVLCTSSDDGLYLYQVPRKYLQGISKLLSGHDFQRESFNKNVGGVVVIVLCTSSDNALYLYQVL